MTKQTSTVGIIGIGHLAQYLIQGFQNKSLDLLFKLYNRTHYKAASLEDHNSNIYVVESSQEAITDSDIVIVATRPNDLQTALKNTLFKPTQVVVCVAAGVTIAELNSLVSPAKAVRVLPISSVAINIAPILQYPENKLVYELFSSVGTVHILPNEETFAPATAIVGAFYAWIFPLMNEVVQWAQTNNINEGLARQLTIETIESATGMAKFQNKLDLSEIWETLATPGGISELGLNSLQKSNGLQLWSKALDEVVKKLCQ